MKFSKTHDQKYNVNYAPFVLDGMNEYHINSIIGDDWLHAFKREAKHYETDKRNKLETIWYYNALHNGSVVFSFASTLTFNIDDESVPPTDDDLKMIIASSHNYLRDSFEGIRKEFQAFKSIESLSSSDSDEVLEQLYQVFDDEQA